MEPVLPLLVAPDERRRAWSYQLAPFALAVRWQSLYRVICGLEYFWSRLLYLCCGVDAGNCELDVLVSLLALDDTKSDCTTGDGYHE